MRKGLSKVGDLSFMKELTAALPEATETKVSASPVPAPLQNLEGPGRAVAKRETSNVIQLPLWHELERGTPNSFLRSALFSAILSKDRQFLKEATLAGSKDVSVKFTGEQLNQEDLTVWEALVHLARSNPLGDICNFTAYGLLKSLGLQVGGEQHRILHSTIIRLNGAVVEITHDGKTYFGTLIQSGVKEELTKHYAIKLNPELIRLYGETQWTALNWEERLKLRRKPLAQALHGYYSSHGRPYAVKVATLQHFTGSQNPHAGSFKRQVRKALDELVKIGFLSEYRLDGDVVKVART